jgi:hypothetical protein
MLEKRQKRVTICQNVTRFYQTRKTCFRHWDKTCHDCKNMTRFLQLFLKTCHDYLKRDTILGEFLCLFMLKSIPKTGVTNSGERKCDLQTWRLKNGAISSILYQFMYVLILPLIMLFVNSIMSS